MNHTGRNQSNHTGGALRSAPVYPTDIVGLSTALAFFVVAVLTIVAMVACNKKK